MSLAILRRLRAPAAIDSSPAPTLAVVEHIDITDDEIPAPPPRPVVVDAEQVTEPTDFHPDTMVAPSPSMRIDHRPPVARGTCYHDGHALLRRGRVGLLVDGDHASLLPCSYANAEGR